MKLGPFMPKRTTIIDVAELAGVSTMTVSRVMSGSPKVRESTRQKVKKAISTLNYQPEFSARALSKKITGNLGFLVRYGNENREFYHQVANGIEDELNKHDYSLISHYRPFDAAHLPSLITQRKVDGAIVGGVKVDEEVIKALQDRALPVVVIDNFLDVEGIHFVFPDYQNGADEAVRYLNRLGHRNIAFIGKDSKYFCTICKLEGYRNALEQTGNKIRKECILFERSKDFKIKDLIRQIMLEKEKVTAVLCANDSIACNFVKILRENRIKVPDDVSIIGFNNTKLAEINLPALTTVHVDKELIGSLAAQKLLESIRNPKTVSTKTVIETRLIIRDSCKENRKSQAANNNKKHFINRGDVALFNS